MNTIYHWFGILSFWTVVAIVLYILGVFLWQYLGVRPKNMLTWFKVFVLNRPMYFSKRQARVMLSAYGGRLENKKKWLHSWERDIVARSIRYSKKRGWKPAN